MKKLFLLSLMYMLMFSQLYAASDNPQSKNEMGVTTSGETMIFSKINLMDFSDKNISKLEPVIYHMQYKKTKKKAFDPNPAEKALFSVHILSDDIYSGADIEGSKLDFVYKKGFLGYKTQYAVLTVDELIYAYEKNKMSEKREKSKYVNTNEAKLVVTFTGAKKPIQVVFPEYYLEYVLEQAGILKSIPARGAARPQQTVTEVRQRPLITFSKTDDSAWSIDGKKRASNTKEYKKKISSVYGASCKFEFEAAYTVSDFDGGMNKLTKDVVEKVLLQEIRVKEQECDDIKISVPNTLFSTEIKTVKNGQEQLYSLYFHRTYILLYNETLKSGINF
ncbi:hypothetical protein AAIR98_000500 [Elusimicrobium simillimum]|uniref:hypothetical protein n=1 Tax=Elusimicrobium simillimum TaxID=3143438 RepID=UPI003C6FBBBE